MEFEDRLGQAISESIYLSRLLSENKDQERFLVALSDAKIDFVLVGGMAVGVWTGRPRATIDVDVIVVASQYDAAVKVIQAKFPELEMRDRDAITRFVVPGEPDKKSKLDLMKPKHGITAAALKNVIQTTVGGVSVKVPDLETFLGLKYASMIGIHREREDKAQDLVDFVYMVKNNEKIDMDKLEKLGQLVHPGGGREIVKYVDDMRHDRPITI